MRSETSEALGRLVSIFVAAIEGAGEVIPDSAIDQLAADPLGTCERLNELALSCGAIDEGVDTALAAIYESMDATDARGNVDEECVAHVVAAWTSTHVERPVEEPAAAEAKPESEEKPAAETQAGAGSEEGEPAEKPKRRRNRKRREAEEPEAANEPETPREEQPAEKADVKPGRRSRARAKGIEQTESGEGPEKPKRDRKRAAKTVEEQAEASDRPTGHAETEPAAREQLPVHEASASPANAEASAPETLSVDQATAILGVSRPTIYKLIESGELPAHKKGRSWRISAAAVADRASGK